LVITDIAAIEFKDGQKMIGLKIEDSGRIWIKEYVKENSKSRITTSDIRMSSV
jgi:hypothetical protein